MHIIYKTTSDKLTQTTTSRDFTNIEGLHFTLLQKQYVNFKRYSVLVTLNIPSPYIKGAETPKKGAESLNTPLEPGIEDPNVFRGLTFRIETSASDVVISGGVSYEAKKPESDARLPITLVGYFEYDPSTMKDLGVGGSWSLDTGTEGVIDTLCTLSAIVVGVDTIDEAKRLY